MNSTYTNSNNDSCMVKSNDGVYWMIISLKGLKFQLARDAVDTSVGISYVYQAMACRTTCDTGTL